MMGVTARFVKGVVLETEEGTRTESKRRWAVFLHTGCRPGSEGYIQDEYTMHKAELGQMQNKRTYKDGKDNMTVTRVHCPVTSVGCVESGRFQSYSTCSLYNVTCFLLSSIRSLFYSWNAS